ncbi:MAG: polymer-forming cytoskeletal protein [Polyangiaceae bacterium]|nr:polymer-forming cytoskeletal protein [Polyangiaceae bacterium]
MFGKGNNGSTTIIGRGARFVGTLELEGAAYVEGRCEGTVRAKGELSVGPQGSVFGELVGKVVLIAGQVEGTVIAQERLHVFKTGSLKGDAYYGRLQVDSGGVIDGQSHQGARVAGELGPHVAESFEEPPTEQAGVADTRVRPISVRPAGAESRNSVAAGRR